MNFLHGVTRSDAPGCVFDSSGVSLDMRGYSFMQTPAKEQKVILGIRPEDLHIHAQGALRANVSLIEPMGGHHIVWLDFAGNLLSCVVTGPLQFKVDETVQFSIDMTRISLFDSQSEQRL